MSYVFHYPDLAEALYHALKEDAFYIAMENSADGDGKEAMLRYMDFSMKEAAEYGRLYIPQSHRCGVSIWSKPLSAEREAERSALKKSFIMEHMGKGSLDTYKSIVEFMSARAEEAVSAEYWYLSILGVLPEYQGQGLGVGLVESVLKEADEAGVPTYLETFTPRNMSFYKRLGYAESASFTEPLTGTEYFIMTRPPVSY
jgi:GNAT superfamily N-acetyltransferase